MKLLLLEDDVDAREALASLLSFDGFDVIETGTEHEFVQATASLDIGAVVFDLWLGKGIDAIHLVMNYQHRRIGAGHPPARLVCVTGSMELPIETPMPFPLTASLRKPAEYSAILSAVRARTSPHSR